MKGGKAAIPKQALGSMMKGSNLLQEIGYQDVRKQVGSHIFI